jgi:signal transduction histidine kinase
MPLHRLTWRVGLPFVLLVLIEMIALAAFLGSQFAGEERAQLERVAAQNAAFLESSSGATTPLMAERLQRVIGYDVFFRDRGGLQPAPPAAMSSLPLATLAADGRARQFGDFECAAVAIPGTGKADLVLVRALTGAWGDSRVLAVLAAFLLLAIATAWFLGRWLVRPLQDLARQLPLIERTGPLELPAAARDDEIGDLARSYLRARNELHEAQATRERLEKLAVLVRMTAALAHEVQNPVAAIRMHAQLWRSGAHAANAAATIEHEAARIDSLLSQWLFLTRPDPPAVAPVDVRDLLAEVVATHRHQAEHAAVEVRLDAPPGLVANADRRRLDQVFRNLLVNAVQAMPRGGALAIRAERADGMLRIAFADTGTGFSPRALQRFAEYFFSEKEGGMGIGLAVASEILKAHGGNLRAANRDGPGAIVTVELPAAARAANDATPAT